ncbi:E3 ubiquitin-protein ligase TRIM21-like isoform X2 [Perca fluviatilis]|uniref:E3 ubiquitin-protein ligase TRIM21-like isoform X2 n=1 Tax=Perca fluviatilis TaxID=8168 RepID=UPI0019650E9A|nr:E3 ubiquitin-protein ligase TRIM21-like isoform X2 [Perca fluviatilis]
MMAEAATPDLFSEQELTCSICLDLFNQPVSTPCGHNFCQACIGGYWASGAACTCPLCKRQFDERPQLSVNKVFALIAEKFKLIRYGAAGLPSSVGNGTPALAVTPDDPSVVAVAPGDDVVWCDVCTGLKQPAVSSCLTCTASYCSLHLQPHHSTPFYAKHPLMSPQDALRGRTCRVHRRLLEVYCRTCERCICALCVLDEHRIHKTVSVQTERLTKQKQVARTEQEILNRIGQKEIHVTQLKRKLDAVKSLDCAAAPLAEDQDADLDEEFSEFSLSFQLDDVKNSLADIRDRMDLIRMGGGPTPRGGSVSNELTAAESMLSLRGSSANLRKSQWSLRDMKRMKHVSGHKKVRVYMEDVALNPVTAYPFLILSSDRKQVKRGETLQFFRSSPQRYDVWSCVLAKEGYATGRHYWEVFIGESRDWKLGVVTETASRKGLFDMSPSNGYYALWWSGGQLRALTAPPLTKVKSPPRLRQVGVFLDVDEGHVTFYNAKSGSEIYSFSGTAEFTERMFPLLGTGDKETPLVLMTTQPDA